MAIFVFKFTIVYTYYSRDMFFRSDALLLMLLLLCVFGCTIIVTLDLHLTHPLTNGIRTELFINIFLDYIIFRTKNIHTYAYSNIWSSAPP